MALTVFIFFFGPVDWYIPSHTKLAAFLLVNYGGLWLGYWLGIGGKRFRRLQSCRAKASTPVMPRVIMLLLVWSMVFNIAGSVIKVHAIRGIGTVLSTLAAPGTAYREAQVVAQMSRDRVLAGQDIMKYRWVFRIDTLLGALSFLYFPLGVVYWRRMSKTLRLTFIVSLLGSLLFTLGVGAQSGVGFLLFSYLPVALFKYYSTPARAITPTGRRRQPRSAAASTRRRIRITAAAFLVLLIATVASFQISRAQEGGQPPDALRALVREFGEPSQGGLLRVTGTTVNYGLVMTALYASHGYAGLALSMELPFEWTYGLGWSKALQVIYHDYLGGPDLFETSYLARNQTKNGWPALTWWSTVFAWVASDTTFYGTAFFTLLVGLLIGRCWADVLVTGNPFGLALLGQLFILVFMFPANNAVAQTLGGFFSFIGVLLAYALSRRYFTPARGASALKLPREGLSWRRRRAAQ